MPIVSNRVSQNVSRRRLFVDGAALTCAFGTFIAAAAAAGPVTAATKKISQKTAGYQDKPMGKAKCDVCKLWQPPGSCVMVDGPISPSGWCNLYNPKS